MQADRVVRVGEQGYDVVRPRERKPEAHEELGELELRQAVVADPVVQGLQVDNVHPPDVIAPSSPSELEGRVVLYKIPEGLELAAHHKEVVKDDDCAGHHPWSARLQGMERSLVGVDVNVHELDRHAGTGVQDWLQRIEGHALVVRDVEALRGWLAVFERKPVLLNQTLHPWLVVREVARVHEIVDEPVALGEAGEGVEAVDHRAIAQQPRQDPRRAAQEDADVQDI
eukprot:UN0203